MDFFPTDMSKVQPSQGFGVLPAGHYVLEVKDTVLKPTQKDPNKVQVMYQSTVIQGPDTSMDFAGTPFTDFILLDPTFMGQHKQLLLSCYDENEEALLNAARQAGAPAGPDGKPQLAPQLAIGKRYLAKVTIRKWQGEERNNVVRRLPVGKLQEELGGAAGGFSAGAAVMGQFAKNVGAPPAPPSGQPSAPSAPSAPPAPPAQPLSPPPGRTFYVSVDGSPVKKTEAELKDMVAKGYDGPVLLEGTQEWKKAADFGIQAQAGLPAPPPPPAPVPGQG